jgi:hypothetical protein
MVGLFQIDHIHGLEPPDLLGIRSYRRNYYAKAESESAIKGILASPTIPSWNEILVWLREMDLMQKEAAAQGAVALTKP